MRFPSGAGITLDRILHLLSRAFILIAGLSLVVLIAIFGWLVFGRYVLNRTPTWVEQFGLLLIVWITFLAAAVGVREDTHLGVTFIRDSMPARVRHVLFIVGDLVLAAFGAAMALEGARLVRFGWSTNLAMLDIPEGVRTIPLVLCGAMISLVAGLRAGRRIRGDRDGPGRGGAGHVADTRP